jgi:phosphoribulokinase
LEKREPESQAFIRPQREFADIVVRFSRPEAAGDQSALNANLVLRPTLPHPDLTYLVTEGNKTERAIRLTLGRDAGRPVDFLEIDGHVADEHAVELEQAIQSHLPDEPLLDVGHHGEYQAGTTVQRSSTLALTQLLLTYHVLRLYRNVIDVPFAPAVAALERLKVMRPLQMEPAASRVPVAYAAEPHA